MELYSVNTGFFKLDGGAMFGVVPKSIWNRLNPADDNNMCSWAMRSLLVVEGDRALLIDSGIGDKQDKRFFGFYYLHGDDSLEGSLARHGFSPADITDHLLTHLHFDHCGGTVRWNADRTGFEAVFPNAAVWMSRAQWDTAHHPNPREKASFLSENIDPIPELYPTTFLTVPYEFFPGVSFHLLYGHTDGMILPIIRYKGKTIIYMADLIPSAAHVKIPYIMAYDIRPLDTFAEKTAVLSFAVEHDAVLFFEHDPVHECATVKRTKKGFAVDRTFPLSEIL